MRSACATDKTDQVAAVRNFAFVIHNLAARRTGGQTGDELSLQQKVSR
jgi:hypothetical protein